MKFMVGTVALVLASMVTVPALGQGNDNMESFDFRDELVIGDHVRPDGETLQARQRSSRTSLIRLREHFVPEMLKSVEDI
jgi:starvation-inducible outer membrane lipoprotein